MMMVPVSIGQALDAESKAIIVIATTGSRRLSSGLGEGLKVARRVGHLVSEKKKTRTSSVDAGSHRDKQLGFGSPTSS